MSNTYSMCARWSFVLTTEHTDMHSSATRGTLACLEVGKKDYRAHYVLRQMMVNTVGKILRCAQDDSGRFRRTERSEGGQGGERDVKLSC